MRSARGIVQQIVSEYIDLGSLVFDSVGREFAEQVSPKVDGDGWFRKGPDHD